MKQERFVVYAWQISLLAAGSCSEIQFAEF